MIDHFSFDCEVDEVLDATEEMLDIVEEMGGRLDSSIMRTRKIVRLGRRARECREDIERHMRSLVMRHLMACEDRTPWMVKEHRDATSCGEWIDKRFGEPYKTNETLIRESDLRELEEAHRDVAELRQKLKNAEAQAEGLGHDDTTMIQIQT